jgi:hypothetical protein
LWELEYLRTKREHRASRRPIQELAANNMILADAGTDAGTLD